MLYVNYCFSLYLTSQFSKPGSSKGLPKEVLGIFKWDFLQAANNVVALKEYCVFCTVVEIVFLFLKSWGWLQNAYLTKHSVSLVQWRQCI